MPPRRTRPASATDAVLRAGPCRQADAAGIGDGRDLEGRGHAAQADAAGIGDGRGLEGRGHAAEADAAGIGDGARS